MSEVQNRSMGSAEKEKLKKHEYDKKRYWEKKGPVELIEKKAWRSRYKDDPEYREKIKLYNREQWAKNRERNKETDRLYYQNNHEKCLAASRDWCRIDARRLRLQVLLEYGAACKCCGETTQEFLAIDHINGNGLQHRKRIGYPLYKWLKKQGWPKDNFRLLCHDCNCARGYYGYCPHERMLTPIDSFLSNAG